jgi:hypothetical protein
VDAAALLSAAAASARQARAGDHAAALAPAEEGLAPWTGGPDGEPASELDAADSHSTTVALGRKPIATAITAMVRQPVDDALGDELSVVQHGDPVGELVGFVQVLGSGW